MTKYQDIYMMLDANAITNVVDAYIKGRADMLESIIQVEKNQYYCIEDLCDESKSCSDCMVKYLEQLKEQTK